MSKKKRPDRRIAIRYQEPNQSAIGWGDDPSWVIVITATDEKLHRSSALHLNRSEAKQLQRELAWAMPEPVESETAQ